MPSTSAAKHPGDLLAVLADFFNYFANLTAARRERPTEDLASAIANARINGEPLTDMDTASYYVIIASAGHDTTKDAITGGLHALIENPGELKRLKCQPGSDGHRRRGDDPLDHTGQRVHAHRRRRHRLSGVCRSPPAIRCISPTCRETGTRRSSTTRSVSTSAVIPTNTWHLAMACTSVLVPRWRG